MKFSTAILALLPLFVLGQEVAQDNNNNNQAPHVALAADTKALQDLESAVTASNLLVKDIETTVITQKLAEESEEEEEDEESLEEEEEKEEVEVEEQQQEEESYDHQLAEDSRVLCTYCFAFDSSWHWLRTGQVVFSPVSLRLVLLLLSR